MLRTERLGGVVVWTVDRPETRNAVDHATLGALLGSLKDASTDPDIRAAVLTGASSAFISGGDLRALRGRTSVADAEVLSDLGSEVCNSIARLRVPVIAALAGPAIGGGAEIAVACDMRIAEQRTTVAFRQVRMGLTAAWGAVPRLVALVGAGAAARLLLTAQELDASAAKALGLVDEVTDNGLSRTTALAWATDIALGSPAAVAGMKELLREATAAPPGARALERRLFAETWSHVDHVDAVEAFFEQRAPRWHGR